MIASLLHPSRCVAACKPGSNIRELHELSVRLLCEGIQQLGLCDKASAEEIAAHKYRE